MKKYLVSAGMVISLAVAYFLQTTIISASTTSALLPASDGNYTQWTPSAETSHFSLVDESLCNGNTDYVSTATVGNRESFGVTLGSVADGAVINKIEIMPCASKKTSGGSNSTMNVFYRFNASDSSDAGNYSLSGTIPVNLATTSFSSLSLVKTSTSTLEIGAVYSAGNKGLKLSRMAVVLTYFTIPAAPSNLAAQTVTVGTSTSVSLMWTDNSTDESGFKVERSTDGINFSQITSTGANATSTSDFPFASGTYYYQIRAYNPAGNSGYSNIASTTIP